MTPPDLLQQRQPPAPLLTPSFCLTPTSLNAFLSRARALIDDPIAQHLSALSTPSRSPFASVYSDQRTPSTSRIPAARCSAFVSDTLVPAWDQRDRILTYCESVARDASSSNVVPAEPPPQDEEPDERLDPYSARVKYQKPDSDAEILRRVLIEERGIEDVVRRRTWGVVRDRCIGVQGDWREAMQKLSRER